MLTALNNARTRYKGQSRKVVHSARRINVRRVDGQGHNGGYDGSQGSDSGEGFHVGFIDMLAREERKGVDKLCVEVEGKRDAEWEKLANSPRYIVIV